MKKYQVTSNFQLFICCALLALIPALRGETRDTGAYARVFILTTSFPNPIDYYSQYGMEWGFGILSWIVNLVSSSTFVFFYIYSLATFLAIGIASKNFKINPLEVYLIYLPSFFIIQQLVQIRQGLGSALAYLSVSYIIDETSSSDRNPPEFYLASITSLVTHITSIILIGYHLLILWGGGLINDFKTVLRIGTRNFTSAHFRVLFAVTFIFITYLTINTIDFFNQYFNLYLTSADNYQQHEEYGQSRSLFSLPNIRVAIILLVAYCLYRTIPTLRINYVYSYLIGIYAVGLAIRLIFFNTAIFSGRIGAAFSFAEIFMIPIVLNSSVLFRKWKWVFILIYFVVQGYITLWLQAPFMIEDYFTPCAICGG
jgi:hypothetical protein